MQESTIHPTSPTNAAAATTTTAKDSSKHQINTYHCLCTNLVLATSYSLSALRRRADPSLDHALILPNPPTPRRLLARPDPDASDSASDSDDEQPPPPADGAVTLALSLPRAPQPLVVRRDDGFEKRWLLRCGRCALVVAYQLDGAQFGRHAEGRREDVLYILPGALLSTADMVAGRKLPEAEVALGIAADGG